MDENVKKIRNLYEAYEKGTKEEIKAETKAEIYGSSINGVRNMRSMAGKK